MAAGLLAHGLWSAPPVVACTGPPFTLREHATEAALVVIGDVTAARPGATLTDDEGRSSAFTVEVRSVLRGTADATLVVEDRWSDPCAGLVMARTGDRLALAFGVESGSWERGLTAVAWIRGTPAPWPGMERITSEEVFRLFGLEAPQTSAESRPDPWLPALVAGLIALFVMIVRGATGGSTLSDGPDDVQQRRAN